jgi:hypothetical protein
MERTDIDQFVGPASPVGGLVSPPEYRPETARTADAPKALTSLAHAQRDILARLLAASPLAQKEVSLRATSPRALG